MRKNSVIILTLLLALTAVAMAQSHDQQHRAHVDSALTARYYSKMGDIDTNYITRPETKWTVKVRMNVSGSKIETEGINGGVHFKSEMRADKKATLSIGVSYLGLSLGASLNPAKLMGKYHDTELNFNSYGKHFGFDFIYQDAKNFNGRLKNDGAKHLELPDDILSVKTLNVNAYYALNSRRFSYPAAFSQNYIQRRSAGSLLLAASAMGQHASVSTEHGVELKMTNIGIGAGYGYNYVPSPHWLIQMSALPTFIA